MFDLFPCRLGSLTDLGHCAYELRHCPQCAGAFAVCPVCPSLGELCPGCRHRAVLAQIAAGEVVFPAALEGPAEGQPATAVALLRADPDVAQAGELAHVDQAGAVGELLHVDQGSDQAAMLDAGSTAVYNPGRLRNAEVAPGLGAAAMATPVFVLVLPLVSQDLGPVLQALAPVLAGNGRTNGHLPAAASGAPDAPRLPTHLQAKCYLSVTPCPQHHSYKDTGLVLRYHGNNQCVPCSGQRRPRRTAASQEG